MLFRSLKELLKGFGIEEDRLRLEWISASEGHKVQEVINTMTETVRELGPLGLPDIPVPSTHGEEGVHVQA